MKKIICTVLCMAMVFLAACSDQTPSQDEVPDTQTGEGLAETKPPEETEEKTLQEVIAQATASELIGMIAQYTAEEDYETVYAAALRLIEIDPTETSAYIAAADALAAISAANYEEINRLIGLGAQNAGDTQAITDWAKQNQPDYTVSVPFTPDYTSVDQINIDGITTGNQTTAAKYNGIWRGGLLTWQGDWVYLARPDEGFAIYKMRYDGSGYQRIGDAGGSSLNVIGEWIYFINVDDYKPYKMRTDGSMFEKLNDDECTFLSVSGDWMFYDNGSDSGCLYQVKLDGSERIKLNDYMAMFSCVANGWVYYVEKRENADLCRVPVGGGAPSVVISIGQHAYALKDESGQTTEKELETHAIRTYCIWDDWVYFYDYNDPYGVRRVQTDGTGYELVWPFDFNITTLNVADGVLACSFNKSFEEDGFIIGSEIVTIDAETLEKLQHIDADTAPICTGPNGWIYFMKYGEGLAWYAMDPDGQTCKIG